MYAMNGTNAQKWILDTERMNLKEVEVAEGTYTIQNGSNSTQVLDVKGSSLSDSAKIDIRIVCFK